MSLNRFSRRPPFHDPIRYLCRPLSQDKITLFNGLMFRTNTCGELRLKDTGSTVTLAGWVQTVRKFGAITFVDLRDRYGITQLLFGEELNTQLDSQPLGREFVLQATGTVSERSNKNKNIPTGDIEIFLFL